MRMALIINSIVCVVGTIAGTFFAGASVISIANMRISWVVWLLGAAALVPVAFVISGIGAWLAYGWGFSQVAIGLIALPWLVGILFVALMLIAFKSQDTPGSH